MEYEKDNIEILYECSLDLIRKVQKTFPDCVDKKIIVRCLAEVSIKILSQHLANIATKDYFNIHDEEQAT